MVPEPSTELNQLRSEAAVATSLLRRTNTALDICLVHQSFVSEIGRVLSILCVEITFLVLFWQLRKRWQQ